ncbi:MAG: DUF1566 domain-containing protein, partial [Chloroflexota bacterium]|nr:DUF1566 domain-containing protein [Chloroflexota bacterium]
MMTNPTLKERQKMTVIPNFTHRFTSFFIIMAGIAIGLTLLSPTGQAQTSDTTYPIVDTGQTACYDDSGAEITCPAEGEACYGQDAQFTGNVPSYTDNGDDTVTDNVTGLVWQQSPDTDGDGDIDAADKLTYDNAVTYCQDLSLAGYDDWQLPTIKQLYSLIDFSGVDPSGYEGTDTSGLIPFIDTDYFDFAYGDTNAGERIIDSQYASSNLYVGSGAEQLLFGVNFADGRIKGYGLSGPGGGGEKTFMVACVRENSTYGVNDFTDNGDGTITDGATNLMWMQGDNGTGLNWEEALAYVETQNAANYLGYSDWRLPNVKELQSILDYSRSPDATSSAAIDPLFNATAITNEAGETDYGFYWSSTTHANWTDQPGQAGAYVSFGRALGYMDGAWSDVHGAGAQRSDPKSGDPDDYPTGHGPQGDAIRIYNYVRLVRDADDTPTTAQLAIAKTVATTTDPVQPGDAITYTVAVANSGDADAANVVVTDTLPAAVVGDDLSWTGIVTAGEQVTFTIPATVEDSMLLLGQTVVNTATYSYASGSGSDSASFTVNAPTVRTYPLVDTAQTTCYNNSEPIDCPAEGEAFYGQDAQYTGAAFDYT